jgi:hypothetical protein
VHVRYFLHILLLLKFHHPFILHDSRLLRYFAAPLPLSFSPVPVRVADMTGFVATRMEKQFTLGGH